MQGLSSLQTFPKIPQLLFNSLEDGDRGPKLDPANLSLNSPSDNLPISHKAPSKLLWNELTPPMDFPTGEFPVSAILCIPLKFFSALQANALRFTGRSDLIILSKKMAGKLNLGITLTSYDKVVDEDLQKV